MENRELNKKVFLVFLIYAFVLVSVSWTLQEKFIANGWVALVFSLLSAVPVAWVFTKYMDSKLNGSVDFLIRKIRQITRGDLTQRFQEDPDDILPYGLSYELGEMMKFLRQRIGEIWKSTITLTRSLNKFIGNSEEVMNEIRKESEQVKEFGKTLEKLKVSGMDVIHLLENLEINGSADEKTMDKIKLIMHENAEEFKEKKSTLSDAISDMNNLTDVLHKFSAAESEFRGITKNISSINGLIGATVRQTNLLSLNTSIDSIRSEEDASVKNFKALSSELEKLLGQITNFSEESSGLTSKAEMKIKEIGMVLNGDEKKLHNTLLKLDKANRFVEKLKENGESYVRDQNVMVERVSEHYRELRTLKVSVHEYLSQVNESLEKYDQLSANLQNTLHSFDRMEEDMGGVRKILAEIESFKSHFQIG